MYDAMFTRATRLRLGAGDPATPQSTAFAELGAALASIAGERDIETLIEVLRAAPHGLTTLGGNDRIRPGRDADRLDLLVAQFRGASSRHLSPQP